MYGRRTLFWSSLVTIRRRVVAARVPDHPYRIRTLGGMSVEGLGNRNNDGSISRNQTYSFGPHPTNEDLLIRLREKHMLVRRLIARALKKQPLIRHLPAKLPLYARPVP